MDRQIIDKRWIKPKHYKYIALGLFGLVIVLFLIFRDNTSTMRVSRDTLTVSEVFHGAFQDYIRITGIVEPISIVYLDAVEGGIVEEILIREGSMVEKDDIILQLSNTSLSLNILNSEAQIAEKSNFLRETQINMEQQKLALQREIFRLEHDRVQKKRTYEQNKDLYEKELISREEFLQSKEDYELILRLRDISHERQIQDSIFRASQIKIMRQNLDNMDKNMELIYQRQDNLNVRAPVVGQLGYLNVELGQSVSPGYRIGQVNVLTSYKITAEIDEHYIDRVRMGLNAHFERQTDTFELVVSKVYPDVRDGRFKVDMEFTGEMPENIRTGQSYHISLQLGETEQATQIARGGFYQSTGGQWIFVLAEDGQSAMRRPISVGKQNPRHYEVLEGLEPGEKVITSSYDTYGRNERLVFR